MGTSVHVWAECTLTIGILAADAQVICIDNWNGSVHALVYT